MVVMERRGLQGTGYVRKETGWMTNHPGLAQLLQGECSNKTEGKPWHRHVPREASSEISVGTVRAVLRGERTIECTGHGCCRSSA